MGKWCAVWRGGLKPPKPPPMDPHLHLLNSISAGLKLCSGPVAKKEEQNPLFNMESPGRNLLC